MKIKIFKYSRKHRASTYTAQKMKFSINHFFYKCDQIYRKLRTCSHLLKKSLMENFIFCAAVSPAFAHEHSKCCITFCIKLIFNIFEKYFFSNVASRKSADPRMGTMCALGKA